MAATTLNCPMCGASAATDSTKCEHCGARLATVACPACFGMIFLGAKFCSHCGARVERSEVDENAREACPRCKGDLRTATVGKTSLRECPKCEGVWLNKAAFEQVCTDTEEQSALLGMASSLPTDLIGNVEKEIRYRPCPCCSELMHRVNFARCSHVIVDVCAQHGTWFDKDELREIVEFIRAGGMTKARALEELEAKRRLQSLEDRSRDFESRPSGWNTESGGSADGYDLVGSSIVAAAGLIARLLRK